MAKKRNIDLGDIVKAPKGKVHVHKPPRCKGGKHDASCGGKKSEVKCVELPVPGHDNNVCVCIHLG
jgi:hypothetical protein